MWLQMPLGKQFNFTNVSMILCSRRLIRERILRVDDNLIWVSKQLLYYCPIYQILPLQIFAHRIRIWLAGPPLFTLLRKTENCSNFTIAPHLTKKVDWWLIFKWEWFDPLLFCLLLQQKCKKGKQQVPCPFANSMLLINMLWSNQIRIKYKIC